MSVACSYILLFYAMAVWWLYFYQALGASGHHWANITSKALIPQIAVGMLMTTTLGSLALSQFTDPGILNKEIEYLELDRQLNQVTVA